MVDLFADESGMGFFATGHDSEALIARPKNLMDNPTPSDNALAAEALSMHAAFTADVDATERIGGIGHAAGRLIEQYPTAAGHLIAVLASVPMKEVAITGTPQQRAPFERIVWGRFRPDCAMATGAGDRSVVPLLDGRTPASDGARAFVCRSFVCDLPTTSVAVGVPLVRVLDEAAVVAPPDRGAGPRCCCVPASSGSIRVANTLSVPAADVSYPA